MPFKINREEKKKNIWCLYFFSLKLHYFCVEHFSKDHFCPLFLSGKRFFFHLVLSAILYDVLCWTVAPIKIAVTKITPIIHSVYYYTGHFWQHTEQYLSLCVSTFESYV